MDDTIKIRNRILNTQILLKKKVKYKIIEYAQKAMVQIYKYKSFIELL